jgi:hypothetical protein
MHLPTPVDEVPPPGPTSNLLLSINNKLPLLPQVVHHALAMPGPSASHPTTQLLPPAISLPPLTAVHADASNLRKLQVIQADYDRLVEFCFAQYSLRRKDRVDLVQEVARRCHKD